MKKFIKKRKKACAAVVGVAGFVLPCHYVPAALAFAGFTGAAAAVHEALPWCTENSIQENVEPTIDPEIQQFWEDRISGRITPEDDAKEIEEIRLD